jgi:type VI secretion system protein ImpF
MLQEEVVRDLVILLNTTNLESTVDLEGHESVRRSILNYGIPDIAHRTIDELGVADIAAEIEQALMQFEPRLARESLRVERDLHAETSELKLRFLVRADLLSDPLNVPVEFFAEVQADSGKIVVGRA